MLDQKGGQLINEVLNPPAYLRRSTGTGTTVGLPKTATTRGTTGGASSRHTAFQNMVNYGNSKALVAVAETKTQSSGNLGSVPTLNSQRGAGQERPGNPSNNKGGRVHAWGAEGTVLSGQPLAIEYNQDVL